MTITAGDTATTNPIITLQEAVGTMSTTHAVNTSLVDTAAVEATMVIEVEEATIAGDEVGTEGTVVTMSQGPTTGKRGSPIT